MNIKNNLKNFQKILTIIKRRQKLKANMPTVISCNCTAGVIYHDLHQKFTSPTVNLYMKADEFLIFCRYLMQYCDESAEIEEIESELPYPVGVLKHKDLPDIRIFFMHYETFDEGRKKWKERCKRINWNNIVIVYPLLNETEDVGYLLDGFNVLPYKKVALINCETNSIVENIYKFTKDEFDHMGAENLLSYRKHNKLWQWRYLDYFDYVEFINTGAIKTRNIK